MPHDDQTLTQLQAIAAPLIRSKIRRLLGNAGFHEQERDDLEQEVWSKLWPRLRAYDHRRGRPHGFLAIVIERILLNLVRDRFAAKRDVRRVSSLQQKVRTDQGLVELGHTLSEPATSGQANSTRSDTEQLELALDVAAVLAQLPKDKQELAKQLQHHSLAEIARQWGVPRSTLQSQVRQLRELFDHAGLRPYL